MTKTSKAGEVKYRKQLVRLVESLDDAAKRLIIPTLKSFEVEYVNDQYARALEEAFDNLRDLYTNIDREARAVSSGFVGEISETNRKRFYASVEDGIGIRLQSIIQNEDLTDILTATTRENVSLIKSIPDEYFKKIETLVFTGTTQGRTAGSMIDEIKKLGKVTERRAKLIARDQSSKLNSALNQQRQENLGITEYIWRTSGDGRVRVNHASKNGKVFRWDSPPQDTGHPGADVQCRCVAQPIIKL